MATFSSLLENPMKFFFWTDQCNGSNMNERLNLFSKNVRSIEPSENFEEVNEYIEDT